MYTVGLVFLEMVSVIKGHSKSDLSTHLRKAQEDKSLPILNIQTSPELLYSWLGALQSSSGSRLDGVVELIKELICVEPDKRLKSRETAQRVHKSKLGSCCQQWYDQRANLDNGISAATNLSGEFFSAVFRNVVHYSYSTPATNEQQPDISMLPTSISIHRIKTLEWRLAIESLDGSFWLPATAFHLKQEGNSISIAWSHFNDICKESDGNWGFYFWRGTDPQKTSHRLTITFSSESASEDIRRLKRVLTFTDAKKVIVENDEIRISNTQSVLFRSIHLGEDILSKPPQQSCYESPNPAFFSVQKFSSGWTEYMLYLVPKPLTGIDLDHTKSRLTLSGLESISFEGSERQRDGEPDEVKRIRSRKFVDQQLKMDCDLPTQAFQNHPKNSQHPLLKLITCIANPWTPYAIYSIEEVSALNRRWKNDKLGPAMMVLWDQLPLGSHSHWISLRFTRAPQKSRQWLHGEVSWKLLNRQYTDQAGTKTCDIQLDNCFYLEYLDLARFENAEKGDKVKIRLHSSTDQELEFRHIVNFIQEAEQSMIGGKS
ncbi:hypothetical protein F5Y16DRAFT_375862 [Xylariaceae sp. FL0255]|nr:hypothetical protein F5Y16DRAFT_375862 [Xylariaceae sp. FL0255]